MIPLILSPRQTIAELIEKGLPFAGIWYDVRARKFYGVEREQALVEELRRFKPDSEVLRFYEEVSE